MLWHSGDLLLPDTFLPDFDGKWTGAAPVIQEVHGDQELKPLRDEGMGHPPGNAREMLEQRGSRTDDERGD